MLPSESELSAEFGVSRVTVRRALETLRDERLVESRQGFGWFVCDRSVAAAADPAATRSSASSKSGASIRSVRSSSSRSSPRRRTSPTQLDCDQVLRVKRLNLADGEPFAVVTVWCPAELGQNLSRRDVERQPFYELLGDRAPRRDPDHRRRVGQRRATRRCWHVPAGSPVLRCERLTTDTNRRKVLLSEHIFPAHRTEFVVDLPQAEPSIAPSGLRLVE